ncbi:MAG: hypothetical protein LBU39_05635 [Desulfobulbaceae bacterium]|jgi:hypothetical protein|nr:hypothetical protein [Desulfobulbaceae bacterium]
MPMRLRITSTPPGEAPFWVREKGLGLNLPLAQRKSPLLTVRVFGIFTGPKGFVSGVIAFLLGRHEKQSGYVVETLVAIEVLAQSSPQAAAWWRENVPHLIKPRPFFFFQQGVGSVVKPGCLTHLCKRNCLRLSA